jgi:basic membrane protein A
LRRKPRPRSRPALCMLSPARCSQHGGSVECKDGNHLSDAQIRSMNFYVKGIDDRLPAK